MNTRFAVIAVIGALLPLAAGAQAPSCDNPDTFCVGDPCFTTVTSVVSPCVVDFGARTLIIGRRIRMPDNGVLHFTARAINVKSLIDGRGLTGGHITLTATDRIDQRGRVDTSGTVAAGSILFQAGGDIALDGKIKSVATSGSGVAGGTITFAAGGRVTCSARCGVDVRGNGAGAGGQATYRGAAGVDVIGHLVAEGGTGPFLQFASSAGGVTVGTDIRMRSTIGPGGTILLYAATVSNITRSIEARGATTGGTIDLIAPSVVFTQGARAPGATGGVVRAFATTVTSLQPIEANGVTTGGMVDIVSDSIAIGAPVRATGGGHGGDVSLVATTGDLSMSGTFDVRGGGRFVASAAGALTATGQFQTDAGCVALTAGGALNTSGATSDTPFTSACP